MNVHIYEIYDIILLSAQDCRGKLCCPQSSHLISYFASKDTLAQFVLINLFQVFVTLVVVVVLFDISHRQEENSVYHLFSPSTFNEILILVVLGTLLHKKKRLLQLAHLSIGESSLDVFV